MKKTKSYENVLFRPEHIIEISAAFRQRMAADTREQLKLIAHVELPKEERWDHDNQDEFFADIRKEGAEFSFRLLGGGYDLIVTYSRYGARAVVEAQTRADIEAVFYVIEKLVPIAKLPDQPEPHEEEPEKISVTVFIGHGRNPQWRDLKDHLHEKHGYSVKAYEIGARAGHAIRDILEDMMESSLAFLVMTGEDETADGQLRARQNVIHEIGLFQGKLGFAKAVVLMEDGVEEFSNIHGIQQIQFSKGGIRETYGDVLATINREFPDAGHVAA